MFKASTPESRNAKRDAIAAKYATRAAKAPNPSVVAATVTVAAVLATGWVEALPL